MIDCVDGQGGAQYERIGLSAEGVLALRLVKDAELFDHLAPLVREECPGGAEAGAECGIDERRIGADGRQPGVVDGELLLELDVLAHLLLIPWAEETAEELDDQWRA